MPTGATVTLLLQVPGHVVAHSETWEAADDLDRLYLQAIPDEMYAGIEAGLNAVGVFSDPAACQIVTTATVPEVQDLADFAAFQDLHPYGLAGATASLDGEALGPIYMDVGIVPDATLTSTTVDGGVLWLNAVAGHVYTFSGEHPDGHGFRSPRVGGQCSLEGLPSTGHVLAVQGHQALGERRTASGRPALAHRTGATPARTPWMARHGPRHV